ncbi:F-box only protein 42, partial [Podila minutissima]
MVLLKGYRRSTSCLLTLLASHLLTAYAQSFRPLTVFGASSVFIENKAMYITGGTREGTVANQTFSLDLSSPWTAAAPNFTELENNRAPMDYQIPSALDKDQTRWFIVSGKESYFYDIPRKEWNRRDALANLYNVTATFLQATVDPVSNSLLIPNGFETTTSTSIDSSMMQYDIVRGTTRSISMEGGPINRYAASVVWSTYLNKLVTFGGGLANETFGLVHTYGSSSGWNEMRTANAGPSPRAYHCAVVANDGKKMVVFGGRTLHSITFLGDIYVLDLETWAWSAGTPLNSGLNRSSIACGASGDYFVSWGGLDQNRRVVASNYTLLFNIKTMSWTDSFVPPPSLPEEKKSK